MRTSNSYKINNGLIFIICRLLKELVELVESVYKNDKEARRIENIKTNMNKAADLINDEPIKESIYERVPQGHEWRHIFPHKF